RRREGGGGEGHGVAARPPERAYRRQHDQERNENPRGKETVAQEGDPDSGAEEGAADPGAPRREREPVEAERRTREPGEVGGHLVRADEEPEAAEEEQHAQANAALALELVARGREERQRSRHEEAHGEACRVVQGQDHAEDLREGRRGPEKER